MEPASAVSSSVLGYAGRVVAVLDALRGELARRADVPLAIVFGSFARGDSGSESDVDLTIAGPDVDRLDLAAELATSPRRFLRLGLVGMLLLGAAGIVMLSAAAGCGGQEIAAGAQQSSSSTEPTSDEPRVAPTERQGETEPVHEETEDAGESARHQLDPREAALLAISARFDAAGVRTLRVSDDFVVIGDATQTLLCDRGDSPCLLVPFAGDVMGVATLAEGRARVFVAPEGALSETWDVDTRRRRARRVDRWVPTTQLAGPFGRREARRVPPVTLTTAPRPSAASLVPTADPDDGRSCIPRISSTSHTDAALGVELRVASCQDPMGFGDGQPVSLRASWGALDRRPWQPSAGMVGGYVVALDVLEIVRVLDDAIVFVASRTFGSSPNGGGDHVLFVATRGEEGRLRLSELVVGSSASEGLGTGESGEYEVAVDRRRVSYALRVADDAHMPAAIDITGCTTWHGIHFRGSDRWRGASCTGELGVTIPFDPRRGVLEDDDALRASVAGCCPSDEP